MKSFNRIRQLSNVTSDLSAKIKPKNCVVADIGTDHGYLAELLSRDENITKIYATDISQKCLDKTNTLIEKFNLTKIETKLGNGLEPIDRADLVVLAGIGGYEIIKILSNQNITKNGDKKCGVFVLQPSKNVVELRKWIFDNGYAVSLDKIVKSGSKFYPIIVIDENMVQTREKSLFNLYFGRDNSVDDPDFVSYLTFEKQRMNYLDKVDKKKEKNSNDLKTKIMLSNLIDDLLKNKGE